MNTEIRHLFDDIESPEFAARLSVASDLRTLIAGIATEGSVQELKSSLKNEDVRVSVLRRCASLSRMSSDPRYENPNDTALTVYLLLLDRCSPQLARLGAHYVSATARCWWADKLACYFLFEESVANVDASESIDEVGNLPVRLSASRSYNVSMLEIGELHALVGELPSGCVDKATFEQAVADLSKFIHISEPFHVTQGRLQTGNQRQDIGSQLWQGYRQGEAV